MALKYSSKGGGDFKGVAAGNYIAVCDLVADLGLQPGRGMFPDPKFQVHIRFEIPGERIKYEKDGKQLEGPRVIGRNYTAAMGKKANLRKDLESWRGRAFTDEEAGNFDIGSILGKPCMVNVIEKESGGKTYSNIGSISALPKGILVPVAENAPLLYDPNTADAADVLAKLPNWLQEKIKNPAKMPASHATGVYAEQTDNYDFGVGQEAPPQYGGEEFIQDSDIPTFEDDDDSDRVPF